VLLRRSMTAILLCTVVLLSVHASTVQAKAQHFLDYSEDNYKVVFISGNLTAAITHDWPRVVFEHTTDPFSPTFEVGLPRMFLYNDSNEDGFFSLSEVTYVSYLDANHVSWNVTPVEFEKGSVSGESAMFRMNATLNLYEGPSNATVAVRDWATIAFWFRISQYGYYHNNSLGSYLVRGKTDLAFNYTLDIIKPVETTGVVMEHLLQGGGSTYMFLLRQMGRYHSVVEEFVSARVDETVYGANFTNSFQPTYLPDQQVSFAKDDRTAQAYYRWDSEPTITSGNNSTAVQTADSYFTTGTGLMFHHSFLVGNGTGSIHQAAIVGIDETAFVGKISDWLKDNIWEVVAFTACMVVLIVVSAVALGRKKRRKMREQAEPHPEQSDVKQG
jgi:hypothetical protein